MRTIVSVLAATYVGASATAAAGGVRVYPVDPSEGAEAPYSVRAGGVDVPLERVGRDQVVYYGRFESVSPAEVVVTCRGSSAPTADVEPARLVDKMHVEAGALRFMATDAGPRLCFIRQGGQELPPLFVIVDPPEPASGPAPNGPNVLNVAAYGARPGRTEPQTAGLQEALDACAARPGGGVVYVPAGHYYAHTLRVGDSTYLYLAAGAVVQAVPDPAGIPVDAGREERGGEGVQHSFSRLLLFDGADNARLGGRGTLDASGYVLRNKYGRRCQVIDAHNCRNLRLDGVVIRNTGSWSVHLLHCDGVHVSNVKVITDWDVGNADGINPDSCRNVLIEKAFCYTGDDSFAVKATNNSDLLQSSYNITIRDSVVMTRKTGLKIGTETRADISNVLYENIDCVRTSRGIGLWARDGGTISNVIWRDIRMDLVEVPREGRSGQPFYVMARKRHGQSHVENVVIENVTAAAPWYSKIETSLPWPIRGITFRNIRLTVKPRTIKQDARYLFEFDGAEDIVFDGLTVDWSHAAAQHWNGLWPPGAPVIAEKVKEIGWPSSKPEGR
jgi:hypothetical protein